MGGRAFYFAKGLGQTNLRSPRRKEDFGFDEAKIFFLSKGNPAILKGKDYIYVSLQYHIYCTLIAWSHVTTSDPLTWSDFPFNQVFGGGRAISKKQAKSR